MWFFTCCYWSFKKQWICLFTWRRCLTKKGNVLFTCYQNPFHKKWMCFVKLPLLFQYSIASLLLLDFLLAVLTIRNRSGFPHAIIACGFYFEDIVISRIGNSRYFSPDGVIALLMMVFLMLKLFVQ